MAISTTDLKYFEMDGKEQADFNEAKLLQFKELFLTTDMPVDDIWETIGVTKGTASYRWINGMRKQYGCSAKDRDVDFNITEQSTEERYAELEEFYQEFKKLWLSNPKISKKKAYQQLGKTQKKERVSYVNKRMKEDNLPEHYIHKKGRAIKKDEIDDDELYQEYKKLFLTTDIPLKQVREQLGISHNSNDPIRAYIIKRSKEDGLDGRKRNMAAVRKKNLKVKKNKEKKPKPKKEPKEPKKEHVKKEESHIKPKSNYTDKTMKMVNDSMPILDKMFHERNVKDSTKKGYIASFTKWCEFTKDRFNNLQDMLDFYYAEEKQRLPLKERTIKKDLMNFREFLINTDGIKSDRSFNTYFSKLKTIFTHHEIEIPHLQKMKIEKGYVSNYNDLPTHDMIRTACEQSPLDLKAVVLFMSSSGSAKAETLSITVGMFLEGCSEYLEETPTASNIDNTLKALTNMHDIVPMIYLRRIKTDKWYYTYCSPEASYMIIESLKTRKNLQWNDKIFDYTSSLLLTKFQEINDNNDWGFVGSYRRFRSHALRKFMASNIGLPRDITDSIQGRSKDMIQEAYFKQDPKALKKTYMEVMHKVMVYENWGHGTTLAEIERQKKRLFNDFKDDEKIIDLSVIPETPEEIKTTIGIPEPKHADKSTKGVNNGANTMPITPPVQMPVGHVEGVSVSQELLNYAELMEKGLLSIAEFNRVKQKLLMSVLR